jgi:hypothetical protein
MAAQPKSTSQASDANSGEEADVTRASRPVSMAERIKLVKKIDALKEDDYYAILEVTVSSDPAARQESTKRLLFMVHPNKFRSEEHKEAATEVFKRKVPWVV